jgi:hypothetical protein
MACKLEGVAPQSKSLDFCSESRPIAHHAPLAHLSRMEATDNPNACFLW